MIRKRFFCSVEMKKKKDRKKLTTHYEVQNQIIKFSREKKGGTSHFGKKQKGK